jgi:hypothetical protein
MDGPVQWRDDVRMLLDPNDLELETAARAPPK